MKIRIEIEDDGMKSIHEFEGVITRDRIVEFLDAIGIFAKEIETECDSSASKYDASRTLRDKLETFIRYEFSNTWFSSNDLRDKYETVRDDIKFSTVSTYLSRMYYDGVLERRGNRSQRQYRLVLEDNSSDICSHNSIESQREKATEKW